jgi:hypothetical protein
MALAIASDFNRLPQLFSSYSTATPLNDFQVRAVLTTAMGVVLFGLTAFAGSLSVDVFRKRLEGDRRLPDVSWLRALAVAALLVGVTALSSGVSLRIPGPRFSVPLWNLPGVDSLLPGLGALESALTIAGVLVGTAAIVAYAAAYYFPPRRLWLVACGVIAVFAINQSQTFLQWVFYFAFGWAAAGLVLLLWKTSGSDLLTFGLGTFWAVVAGDIFRMAAQPSAVLRWNAVGAGLTAVFAGAVWVISFRQESRRPGS